VSGNKILVDVVDVSTHHEQNGNTVGSAPEGAVVLIRIQSTGCSTALTTELTVPVDNKLIKETAAAKPCHEFLAP